MAHWIDKQPEAFSSPEVCQDCQGRLIFGPELHLSRTTYYEKDGRRVEFSYRCEQCIERYARQLWDEEDQGPAPYRIAELRGRA